MLFLLPILPLKSYRIRKLHRVDKSYGVAWSQAISYQILKEVPRSKTRTQIIATYAYAYGGLLLFIVSLFLASINDYLALVPVGLIGVLLIWALLSSE